MPSLWCLLIVGIKGKRKKFLPFTLALVCTVVCQLQSSQCPLGGIGLQHSPFWGGICAALPAVLQDPAWAHVVVLTASINLV